MEDYNWNLISAVALPVGAIEAMVFYTSLGSLWQWIIMLAGMTATGIIIYMYDKRKANLFTAIGIVFLAGLFVRLLRLFGFI